jgi:ribosomal protein S18 acetylase RimI-like enzyme
MLMKIRKYQDGDAQQIINLIAEYRVFLSSLKSISKSIDLESAKDELDDYLSTRYSVYVAVEKQKIVGYIVCKIDQNVVWAESLFVKPSMRRKGIGSALYSEVESLVEKLDGETIFNWVHPNNNEIISFLEKRGYNVLNLIEIRKPWVGEETTREIKVNNHQFRY